MTGSAQTDSARAGSARAGSATPAGPYPGWPAEAAARYRADGYWTDETLWSMLEGRAGAHPERTAVVADDARLTYRELEDRCVRLASGLQSLGLGRGDHVVVQLPNSSALLECYFALMRIGAVPVLALPAHRRTEIGAFVRRTRAVVLITADKHMGFDYRNLAAEVAADCPALEHVIIAGGAGGAGAEVLKPENLTSQTPDWKTPDWKTPAPHALESLYPARPAPAQLPAPPSSGDPALLQLSGGSTGVPKLIPRRHADYLCAARESLGPCPLDEDSVFLAALPAPHNFPLVSPGIFGALYAGATVVLAKAPSPDVAFRLIESEGVTVTSAVPPLALAWLDAAARTRRDLSSLRVLQIGGASCSPELARRIGPELGVQLQQVFGMAEGLINYTRLDDPDEAIIHTQGRPCCAADEVRIVDASDRDLPDGTAGRLLTRGPYTIRGYFDAHAFGTAEPGEADPNAESFTADGFYRTGDLAIRRPDGNITVVGRDKEQINRGGEKVSPEQVENLLLGHPSIHDCAIVGIDDATLGERTCAFVIAAGGADGLDARSVTSFLKGKGLAGYKIPDVVEFVEGFPEIGVGKTSRAELRAALARNRTRAQEGAAR